MYPNAWNKFVPKPIYTPPHPKTWNDLTWPGEYPLAMHEMSFLLPHLLAREARQTRRLLLARLQSGLDEPQRLRVDRGLSDGEGRAARGADADLERDGVLRGLRAADGTRLRNATISTRTRRTTRNGWASARACCVRRASGAARTPPTRATTIPARCGKRTSSGSRCRGASTPTARSGSGKYFESRERPGEQADRRRVLRLYLRQLRARAARASAGGRLDAARVHAALRRLRGAPQDRAVARGTGRAGRVGRHERRSLRPRLRAQRKAPDAERRPDPFAGGRCGGTARRRGARRRRDPARLPDAERPARVLLADARRVGLAANTRCRRTSRVTCTPTIWSRDRWC